MKGDQAHTLLNAFLAGDVCHELFVITNTNIESPQRWYERHVAEEHDLAPPMQRRGGILLTKNLVEKLQGSDTSLRIHDKLSDNNLFWRAPTRPVGSLAPEPSFYQAIYGLQERELLPRSRDKTFRMMTLLSKEFISDSAQPTIIEQLEKLGDQPILAVEDLKLTKALWGATAPGSPVGKRSTPCVEETGFWSALTSKSVKTLLVKTNQPREALASYLRSSINIERIVFIANVTSLLAKAGGVQRSWDGVVQESVAALVPLLGSRQAATRQWTLLLLCGSEGCLVISRAPQSLDLVLHWDAEYSYGALERRLGWVPGPGNVVLASLIHQVQKGMTDDLFLTAWRNARACMILGHQKSDADGGKGADERHLVSLEDQLNEYTKITSDDNTLAARVSLVGKALVARVGNYKGRCLALSSTAFRAWGSGHNSFWRESVRSLSGARLLQLGCAVIEKGSRALDKGQFFDQPFPLLRIGELIAFERSEVEQISYLYQLIADYLDRRLAKRPLSIGVFGKPGAGKSFAVKQILKGLVVDATSLEFNLSPMSPTRGGELVSCFRKVQSCALHGRGLPLVFWDEFDSGDFAWLQHFLAPMQDGEFHVDGDRHSIGSAIFVFAGGTSHTAHKFKNSAARNRAKKAPDFVSRLKAVYDVPDVNVEDTEYKLLTQDEASSKTDNRRAELGRKVIQRALLIRQHLRMHARHIQSLDRRVGVGLLASKDYGSARELENVIEASAVRHADHFGIGALAPFDEVRVRQTAAGMHNVGKGELNIEWD